MQRPVFAVVLFSFVAAGCGDAGPSGPGTGSEPEVQTGPEFVRQDIPFPEEGVLQVVSPKFEVPSGDEVFNCYRLMTAERDMFIQKSRFWQVLGGHHTFLFYTETPLETDPGVSPCTNEMDGNVRYASSGAADGVGVEMPPGIALKVPEGAEVWAQSHYINTTSDLMVAQDVAQLELLDETDVVETAGSFAHVDLGFVLPPREETTRTFTCEFDREINIPWIIPHMHEWGKEYEITIARGSGEVVYQSNGSWSSNLRNEFGISLFEESLAVGPGDTITTTCTWDNTEDTVLTFPKEMCVTFFPTYPSDGSLLICTDSGAISGSP